MKDKANEPGTSDGSLSQLEDLLEREEASLDRLEALVAEEHCLLFGPDPRELLDKLEEIEEGLSRVWQLDAARKRLTAALEQGGCAETDGALGAGKALPPVAVLPKLLAFRHRLLGVIARVGGLNEANGQLIRGLSRVGDQRLAWLSHAVGPAASSLSGTSKRSAAGHRQARLEIRA